MVQYTHGGGASAFLQVHTADNTIEMPMNTYDI